MTDHERRVRFDRLEAVLGSTEAAVLMEPLPPVGWADVARRGDMSELRGEMAELRSELKTEIGSMLPKLIAANIASMVGVAGLVLAVRADAPLLFVGDDFVHTDVRAAVSPSTS